MIRRCYNGVGGPYPRHFPVQVLSQVRLHINPVQAGQRAGVDGIQERRGQGDGTGDLEVVCVILLALGTLRGAGVVDEDAVGADQVGFKGPSEWIGVEVAEEDVDEKRAVEGVFLDSDVGDPFAIGAVLGGGVSGCVLVSWIRRLFPDGDRRLFVAGAVEASGWN